jgi:perosamine synthetase
MINTYVPFLGVKEKRNIEKCFKTNFFSTAGPLIQKFENKFSKTFKFNNSVALNSGTSSLHLGLKAIGVKKGDLVIVPSYTFAATINAIIYCNAEPWFFDINNEFELDLKLVQTEIDKKTFKIHNQIRHKILKKNVKAILPVSSFGKKIDFKKYTNFARKNNFEILFDVAASHNPKIFDFKKENKMNFSFSFNGNKTLTSGSGGVFSTNSKSILSRVRSLANVGKGKSNYDITEVGYNYKMSNIQAAIALAQVDKLKKILKIKKKLFQNYELGLKKKLDIKIFNNHKFLNWVFFITLKNHKDFIAIKKNFDNNGIQLNYFWKPIHMQKPYKKFIKTKMDNTNNIWNKVVILPSHPGVSRSQQTKIINTINKIL